MVELHIYYFFAYFSVSIHVNSYAMDTYSIGMSLYKKNIEDMATPTLQIMHRSEHHQDNHKQFSPSSHYHELQSTNVYAPLWITIFKISHVQFENNDINL